MSEHYIGLKVDPNVPCLAGDLRRQVDEYLNAGAIAEAVSATDELQLPEVLRDGAESGHLTDEVLFNPLRVNCASCAGEVVLRCEGLVGEPNACVRGTSRQCELFWAQRHSENYNKVRLPSDGQLRCAAYEVGCKAVIACGQDGAVKMVSGTCAVEAAGIGWRVRGRMEIMNAELEAPDKELPKFDGIDVNDPGYANDVGA